MPKRYTACLHLTPCAPVRHVSKLSFDPPLFSRASLAHALDAGASCFGVLRGAVPNAESCATMLWKSTEAPWAALVSVSSWMLLEGSTQRIAGDEFSFLPLDSYRLRGGARVNYALGDNFSLYAGAAYEHEFDGTPRARVDDVDIKGDSMRGGTGIGELGLSFTLGDEGSLSMDIGVQGFIGKREGVMGTMRAQFAF